MQNSIWVRNNLTSASPRSFTIVHDLLISELLSIILYLDKSSIDRIFY